MEPKDNSIKLSTFLKYGLTKVVHQKTVETGGKTLVNYVWCKVCAKFMTQIESSSNIKGSAKTSALAFINGTNSVTNYQVWINCYLYVFSI